jgi:hypothetical protein
MTLNDPVPTPAASDYPATFALEAPTTMARWRPLVHWLLVIPHFIVLYVLQMVASVVALVSWFIIVITGRLPEGLATLQTMILRYGMRTSTYGGFLYEDYPPFDFTTSAADPGGSPITVDFEPELEDRNRLTVAFRFILAIPLYFVAMLLGIVAWCVWFVGFFAVIITGSWPAGMRRFIERVLNYGLRVNAYVFLLTDRYPPLYLD